MNDITRNPITTAVQLGDFNKTADSLMALAAAKIQREIDSGLIKGNVQQQQAQTFEPDQMA